MFCNGVCNGVRNGGLFDKSNLRGFMIRKDNGSNNSLFLSCQIGLSDGNLLMIKHTPLPNGNHPISIPICPMAVADTLGHCCTYYNIDLQQGSIHSHEQYKTRKLKYKTHSLEDFIYLHLF